MSGAGFCVLFRAGIEYEPVMHGSCGVIDTDSSKRVKQKVSVV